MTKLLFNKAFLHQESARLKRYQRYLPSLDLKRKQLIAERLNARRAVAMTEHDIERCRDLISEKLPMLSETTVDLSDLVEITGVTTGFEHIMGYSAPQLKSVDINIRSYSMFDLPPWVDVAVVYLKHILELKIRLEIEQKRLDVFDQAVRKITQRLNLFDKVLIPRARDNIRKVQIFLSDAERTALIRAKITKTKRKIEAD